MSQEGGASRPLIVGSRDDPHVKVVVDALSRCGCQPTVLDVPTLEASRFELSDETLVLSAGGSREEMSMSTPRRGWIRRLVPAGWDHDVRVGSHDAAIKSSWLSLLAYVVRASRTTWLSDLDAVVAAESKLLQYQTARRFGAAVPRTVVSSDPERAASVVGRPLVVKPLGPGHFYSNNSPKVILTTELQPDSVSDAEFAAAPFIVQERIEADRHLRIVTVDRRAWGCELNAEGRSLDWRADDDAHHCFVPVSLPEELEATAVSIARELGCGFSSQDWIVAGEMPFFLDLNPSGQWLFLPQETAVGVADAIAAWLVAP